MGIRHSGLAVAVGLWAAAAMAAGLVPHGARSQALSADDIVYRAEERDRGETMTGHVTMVMEDRRGRQRVRTMARYRRDYPGVEKSIYFFLTPTDIGGTAYLAFDWDGNVKDDDSWLYLPALRRTKRLASSDRSDAFLGSDFTYTDISPAKRHYWDYTLIEESDPVDGHDAWLVEGLPKPAIRDKVLRETGYTRVRLWVRKDNFIKVKGQFWMIEGQRIKYYKVSEIRTIDDIATAVEEAMVTTKAGRVEHRTFMVTDRVQYNVPISDSFFTTQQMMRGQ